jgi:hypothetical protein
VVIFTLGLRLLIRHGRGELHAHPHKPPRSLREAYAVGVVHGAGGGAAIGLLILAAIPARGVALAELLVFAISTARRAGRRTRLRLGLWYLAAAAAGAPYPF